MSMKKFFKIILIVVSLFLPTKALSYADNIPYLNYLYNKLGLEGRISMQGFEMAYDAYVKYAMKPVLLIINYDLSSLSDRAVLIDMKNQVVLQTSVVTHGIGSGDGLYATSFSNRLGSLQTSLGAYVAHGVRSDYVGSAAGLKYPNAIVLEGKTLGYNDRAKRRVIVAHQAVYSMDVGGHLGFSHGCPVFPLGPKGKAILDAIQGGGVIFSYSKQLHMPPDMAPIQSVNIASNTL